MRKKSPLTHPIVVSTIGHILFFIFVLFGPQIGWLSPTPPITITWIELPKGSSEDIHGLKETKELPKSTIQDQEIPEPLKPLPKKEPKKEVMPEPKKETQKKVAKPVEKRKKDTSSMRSSLAKIEKRLKKRTEPEAAQIDSTGEGYKHGTGDKPQRVSRDDPEYLKYQASVRARILRQWVLPGSVTQLPANERPRVSIVVMVSRSGDVLSTRWAKKSNLASLNASAIRAIQRASPFPIPPERLKWETYTEGFLVVFDARKR